MYSISSVIGMIALAMAASGIFGFVSFLATQRTKEIGIRISLGVTRSNVRLLVVHQVMSTAWGLFVGTIVALGVSRIFASSIFVMNRALDSVAYGGAIWVVTIAATIAAFVPSERASSLDPVATLRNG